MTTPPPVRDSSGRRKCVQLAAELDLRPTKQRGQNFVIDANTVRRIVRDSGIDRRRRGRRGRPRARLADPRPARGRRGAWSPSRSTRCWPSGCPATIAAYAPDHVDRFEVVLGDAMRIEQVPGPPPTALVANLPYNVSVPVLIHMLTLLPVARARAGDGAGRGRRPARRAARAPRSTACPSVKAAWFADVRRAGSIGRNVFWPAPNVDSGLVAWTRCDPPRTDRHPRAGLRRHRRRVRHPPQADPRRPARRSPGRARPPSARSRRRASTRPRAARC